MFSPNSSRISDWARMREILTILAKHGLGEFLVRIKLPIRRIKHSDPSAQHQRYLSTPRRVRLAFEELGPTFIKLGQILATRADVFGEEWTEEFAHLQNNTHPLPITDIRDIIQAQLSQPLDTIFNHIEAQPIGSASIAQVHRATLTSGEQVAIKVKRPGIESTVTADLRILNHIAQLLESEIPESRRYYPVQMVQYFARSLEKETDLTAERRNMQHFARIYNQQQQIHIPQTYATYSNRQILIQEYIDDTLLKNLTLSSWSKQQRHNLAATLVDIILDMILQHGLFHADPHPGNILVRNDGRITLIDFGLIGRLSQQRHQEIITLIHALLERDQFALQYVLSNWAQGEPLNEDQLGSAVLEMLLNYEQLNSSQLRISQIINDITHIVREYGLTLPADLIILFKCLITLDGVIKQIDGDFELLNHAQTTVQNVLRHRFNTHTIWRHSKMQLHLLAQIIDTLPQNLLRLNKRIHHGQLPISLNIQHIDKLNNQLDKAVNRLTMGIVTAALIIGSSIVMSINAGPKIFDLPIFGLLGYLLAFSNSLWVIWSIWRSGRH
ncbi:ubiquinone biosynthesis protein [Snodgrassella alvi]|jgi:ubiquinone biosynthesis protein|uniref:Ubiquinone biosynthesis protein n=1 Tax=Snodgrassella alvi TaxID=1196083 RepID=A0A2N9XDM7_9NEIS|nr:MULTISPECIES: AarF/UbiB family protein [Snodgrassella]PIT11071.1 ubiquinone biosynthesis protein [Snodgrassella communis]PIT45333.1 ubiquinone biosynthesis protein [Snodgrassella alvi]